MSPRFRPQQFGDGAPSEQGVAAAPAPPGRPGAPDPAASTWGLGEVALGMGAGNVATAVVAAVVFSLAGWSASGGAPMWGLFALQVPLWASYAGVAWWAARARGRGVVEDFGLRMRWWDAPAGLLAGVAVQVVALPIVYLPLLELLGRDADELSRPARALTERADGTAGWVLVAVMVVVGAPLVEELFYRGLLLRALQKRGLPDAVVVVGSAALFAAAHLQPLQFVGLFLLGVLLGVLTLRTGRLGPAIWVHAGFNATTVVSLYLSSTGASS